MGTHARCEEGNSRIVRRMGTFAQAGHGHQQRRRDRSDNRVPHTESRTRGR